MASCEDGCDPRPVSAWQTVSLAEDSAQNPAAVNTVINQPILAEDNLRVITTCNIGTASSKFMKLCRPFLSASEERMSGLRAKYIRTETRSLLFVDCSASWKMEADALVVCRTV